MKYGSSLDMKGMVLAEAQTEMCLSSSLGCFPHAICFPVLAVMLPAI